MNLRIEISQKLFQKDPNSSDLGKKIVSTAICLIDSMGLESFTFKKLANEISSTEASIYRYFENKHKLLIYIISWYWNWLSYRLRIETHRITSPVEKLDIAIEIFCHKLDPIDIPDSLDLN
ncbi:MAG: TetR/AcrR family transcriptional regulator, partial [Bacteroidota bacterium]